MALATPMTTSRPGLLVRLGLALKNQRFQLVLLAVTGVPVTLGYAWTTFFRPWLFPGADVPDLYYTYLYSAGKLAAGLDPYSTCVSPACWSDLTTAGSPYPPLVSWLFVPFVHLDRSLVGFGGLVVVQICIAIFIWTMSRGLRMNGWQSIAAASFAVMAFPPLIGEMVNRNIEVALLTLSGVWFAGYVIGDRWWSGCAVGAAIAIKVVQAPMLLLTLWRRQLRAGVVAAATFTLLWFLGAPQYLLEYLLKVAPGLNTGTGSALNVAPIATVARLLHPGSMYGYETGADAITRGIGYAITIVVVFLTIRALRSPLNDREGRVLEAAAIVAATPLALAIVRPGHLSLDLLPILVVGVTAVRAADWRGLTAVAVSWTLMGPVYLWCSNVLALGMGLPYSRLGAETAVLGALILWLSSLRALSRRAQLARTAAPIRTVGTAAPALRT